jgi:HEAT repeat protein
MNVIEEVRQTVATGRVNVPDDKRNALLIDTCAALKDCDSKVRLKAVIALGQIGDVAAVPALIQAQRDSDGGVRFAASKYTSPEMGYGNHAALSIAGSHLASIFSKDLVVHLNA